jgi:hypothetical protein
MTNGEIATLVMAVIGAATGTASLGWTIYRDAIYRAKLRVDASINFGPPGANTLVDYLSSCKLVVTVTNVGRHSVVVRQIGYGEWRSVRMWRTPTLPRRLEPADSEAFEFPFPMDVDRILYIAAWDSIGRIHRLPKRRMFWLQHRWTITLKNGGVTITNNFAGWKGRLPYWLAKFVLPTASWKNAGNSPTTSSRSVSTEAPRHP